MSGPFRLKWKSDFDKQVILQNFEKRGWVRCSGEGILSQTQTTGTFTGQMQILCIAYSMRKQATDWESVSKQRVTKTSEPLPEPLRTHEERSDGEEYQKVDIR